MTKFDPYQPKNISLKIRNIETDEVYHVIEAQIRKMTISQYRNGYSNWDGKVNFDGYEIKFTRENGEEVVIVDTQRKSVIFEAILREADRLGIMKGNDRFTKLDRKGK